MPSIREQAVIQLEVRGDGTVIGQLRNVQNATERAFSKSEQAMSGMEKSISRGFSNMINQYMGFAAAFTAITKTLSSGVEFNKFVENTTMSFTVMMKSADQAKTMMKELYDFAVNSPLTFKETASSSKQLMAYGFAAKELIPTMKMLGSVALSTGHSLDDISYIYGTLKSQGRAYSRDLMQFGMRGIPIYEELSKVMGVSSDKIQKLASEGKIGFAQVEQAFQNMTTGSGRFAGIIEGYMTTLTGKMSMLGDIMQQSAGTLTDGVTLALKKFVDTLTATFQNEGFQKYIKELSYSLGGLASGVLTVVSGFIKLLPVLTALLPIVIGFLIIKTIYTAIVALPALLASISASALAMGAGLATTTVSMVSMSAAAGEAAISVGLLSEAFVAFAAANPWLLALAAVAAIGGSVIILKHVYEKDALNNKNSTDTETRAAQLASDYFIPEYSLKGMNKKDSIDPSKVADIASEYKLTEERVARILELQGMLNKATYDTYMTQKYAREHLGNYGQGGPTIGQSTDALQAAFLGTLTGKDATAYMPDKGDKDPGAKGKQAAEDYIKQVQATFDQNKLDYGAYYNKDIEEKAIKASLKAIDDAIELGKGVHFLFKQTGYDEAFAKERDRLYKALGGGFGISLDLSKVNFKTTSSIPTLEKWWTPIEKAAEVTASEIDDIAVATEQAADAARAEYLTRYQTLQLQYASTTDIYRKAQIQAAMLKDDEDRLKLEQAMYELSEKQIALKNYEYATQGNSAYFTNLQAQSGAAYANGSVGSGMALQAQSQMLSGTEMGSFASGANPLSLLVTASVDMLKSIENVNKVLNPFATMLGAAKTILEPLINNVMKPIVQILEQFGAVFGQIYTILLPWIKILNVILYVQLTPLIGILNIIGGVFTWLYDSALVPFGNMLIGLANGFIAIVNGVIDAINNALGWTGIHVAQVQYIDALIKTTDAVADLSTAIDNQKSALDSTIDYLTKKINDPVDDQISSLQDLYEVGAISGADYASQVDALNAQKIVSDNLLVSAQDQALTGKDMYERLYELYAIKDFLASNPNLTGAQISSVLTAVGLTDKSIASLMGESVLGSLVAYGKSAGNAYEYLAATLRTANDAGIVKLIAAVQGSKAAAGLSDSIWTEDESAPAAPKAPAEPPAVSTLDTLQGQLADKVRAWNEYKQSHNPFQILAATSDAEATINMLRGLIITAGGIPSYAVGTAGLPQDMLINAHKNEGIIPATFMDSIRSGELTLGGNKGTSGQAVNVYVTVQGSVTSENDLATTVATNIFKQRRLGQLTY